MPTSTILASCLCGGVRAEIAGPLHDLAEPRSPAALLTMPNCHCSRCRKAHGASYATFLMVPEARFRLVSSTTTITRYESSPGVFRPFCQRCGSVVADGTAWDGQVAVPAGLLDGDPGIRPTAHLFAGSKAPWVTLDDELPAFDTYPPGMSAGRIPSRPPLDPNTGKTRGSCLCGSVTYVVTEAPIRCSTCHCSRCRKASAAAHVSHLKLPVDGVQFTRGEELVLHYKVPESRSFVHAFCGICGSSVPRKAPLRGITVVPMGTLDDDPGVRPTMHVFVGSRAPWDIITDHLPQYDEYPPGVG